MVPMGCVEKKCLIEHGESSKHVKATAFQYEKIPHIMISILSNSGYLQCRAEGKLFRVVTSVSRACVTRVLSHDLRHFLQEHSIFQFDLSERENQIVHSSPLWLRSSTD